MGLSFETSSVTGPGLAGRVFGGETLGCLGGVAKEPVKPGRPVIRAQRAVGLLPGSGTVVRLRNGLSLGLGVPLGWPGVARRDCGLVLEDLGLELAVGHGAEDLGVVAQFQGADRGLAQVVEFGVAAVRLGGDGLAGVGDADGFPVGGGRGTPGVVLAQQR